MDRWQESHMRSGLANTITTATLSSKAGFKGYSLTPQQVTRYLINRILLTSLLTVPNSKVSILHFLNICKARNLQMLDGVAVKYLMRVGITLLQYLEQKSEAGNPPWHRLP